MSAKLSMVMYRNGDKRSEFILQNKQSFLSLILKLCAAWPSGYFIPASLPGTILVLQKGTSVLLLKLHVSAFAEVCGKLYWNLLQHSFLFFEHSCLKLCTSTYQKLQVFRGKILKSNIGPCKLCRPNRSNRAIFSGVPVLHYSVSSLYWFVHEIRMVPKLDDSPL